MSDIRFPTDTPDITPVGADRVLLSRTSASGAASDTTLDSLPVSTATTTALATKADDSNTVHRNGVETITAVKTFSAAPVISTITNTGTLTLPTTTGTLALTSQITGTNSGVNTGDQTITLTSDVTGSGTGSFATTIAAGVVTLAKMASVATGTIFYRKTASTGAPEVQTLATLKTDLGLTGTNSGDQTITLTSDVTGTGTGSFATTIGTNVVTNAKAAQMPANTIKGNNTGSTANASDLTVAQTKTLLAITESDVSGLVSDLALKAPLASPTFTGTVTLPAGQVVNGVTLSTAQGTGNFLRGDGIYAAPSGTGDMILASAQTNSGLKTFLDGTFGLRNVANTFTSLFTNTNTAARTYTLKDASGTLAFTSDITGTNSGVNTGDQTITLTGDATGSGTGSFAVTLANTAVTPASYTSANITVDSKGRITAASNGSGGGSSTLASLTDVNLTSLANGQILVYDSGTSKWLNQNLSGGGDMLKATYDPTNKVADVFNQDNMADGTTNKNYTATEKTKLAGIGTGADMVLANVQTVSGLKTFLDTKFSLRNVANTFSGFFTNTNTADRTYTLKDSNGTIAFTSDITGTNSGTNTGDVTLAGTPNYITIAGQVITRALIDLTTHVTGLLPFANIANVATSTVMYRKTAGTGAMEAQTLATLKTDLGLNGTNSGDQTSIVGITGTIAQFNTAITDADITPTSRSISVVGPISGGGDLSADRTITTSMTTNKLIGRGTAGTGVMEEITLGTNLSLTGTTLNATGGGGSPGGSTTQVQFNDSGAFGGDTGLTYDKTNDILNIAGRAGIGITNGGTAIVEVGNTGGLQGLRIQNNLIGNTAFSTFVTADSFTRFSFLADGVQKWSSGSASPDTNLYRSAVGVLTTDNTLEAKTGLKIGTSSTVGYVWKATDTVGNGSWQAGSGGGGTANQQTITSTGQTVFNLSFSYTVGDKGLSVFINGVRQTITTHYTESSTTQVTFTSTVTSGNVVDFVYGTVVGATGATGGTITLVKGASTLNFGSTPGTSLAVTTITGQTAILSTSNVKAYLVGIATATHNIYEHMIVPLTITCGNIVVGTGFDIYASSPQRLNGTFNIVWEFTN